MCNRNRHSRVYGTGFTIQHKQDELWMQRTLILPRRRAWPAPWPDLGEEEWGKGGGGGGVGVGLKPNAIK